jgi:hypothetical protein
MRNGGSEKVCSLAWVLSAFVLAQEPRTRPLNESSNPHVQNHAGVIAEAVWKQTNIPVCWESSGDVFRHEKNVVAQAVRATWETASALRFTGWQQCAAENNGIRIQISDSGPHTKGLGRQLNGKVNGMVLNFTFSNWSEGCQHEREYCIRTIAVHEFGHAIGLAHEQNRPDAPGECRMRSQGSNPTLLLTPYDPGSVMNYCNPKYNNDGALSQLDRKAVAELYGISKTK